MKEKTLRNIFFLGTLLFLVILFGMTANTLKQVADVRTPQLTDAVVSGKEAWQGKNCNDCHTILGIGGYFAPELTKVITRRGAQWVSTWLTDPQAIMPGTTMPNQRLTPDQVSNLVTFFSWVNQVNTNGWPPQPLTSTMVATHTGGANEQPLSSKVVTLVEKGDCGSCHTVRGIPTAVGTDAPDWCISARNFQTGKVDLAYLRRAITDPNADIAPGYKAGLMPTDFGTAFSTQEIDLLVVFIAGLNCD